MTPRQLNSVSGTGRTPPGELLIAYCARPKCRAKFERPVGPGRPKDYCSDECRLIARDEQRTLRSRLAHYEGVTEQIRVDIAAFGRSPDESEVAAQPEQMLREALDALVRAEGILRYAPDSNPITEDLRDLVAAVSPLLISRVSRAG